MPAVITATIILPGLREKYIIRSFTIYKKQRPGEDATTAREVTAHVGQPGLMFYLSTGIIIAAEAIRFRDN